jgi:hypothetical protein
MTARELLLSVRKRFLGSLKKKTGWGRNQVIEQFHYACIGALAEAVGELQDQTVTFPNGSEVTFKKSADEGQFRSPDPFPLKEVPSRARWKAAVVDTDYFTKELEQEEAHDL